MIIFSNPGLIELEAIRNLGVSVKLPGSFGRFGTGLKFAIATILRNGGSIIVYRGLEEHIIGSEALEIRGVQHQIVTLDGARIGFSTTFGKDWQPWMVLRELGCNALDEHGEFHPAGEDGAVLTSENTTTIAVEWDELDSAYKQRGQLFLDGTPLWQSAKLRILPGPSAYLFYRGVRVYKLEKPAAFTYDILEEQYLTEDRTLAGAWQADAIIRDSWVTMSDKEMLSQVLSAGSSYHEHKIDFTEASYGLKPSNVFVTSAAALRDNEKLTNESAKRIVAKAIRSQKEEMSTFGSYRRAIDDSLSYAIEQLKVLGVTFTEEQKFVVLDENLGEDVLSMVEDGRVYLHRDLTTRPAREVMTELLFRWVDLNGGLYSAAELLIPIVVGKSKDLKYDETLLKEDESFKKEEEKRESEPNAAGEIPSESKDSWEPLDVSRGRIQPDAEHGYLLEGEWSRNGKIVHRECVTRAIAKKLEHARIHYTDGTQLILSVRKLMSGESVQEARNYSSLIKECLAKDVWNVANLKAEASQ